MSDILYVTYLTTYVICIIYLVVLGGLMLTYRANPISTHGEQMAKLHMTRTMGVSILVTAFETFLYLPPMLMGYPGEHPIYKVLFLIVLMLTTPLIFNMMFAMLQRKANRKRQIFALGVPFLVLAVWQITAPPKNDILIYTGAALGVTSIIFLLIRFSGEYRIYVHRLQSEYSETTNRDIVWSWICFAGFAAQTFFFVAFQLLWSVEFEILYFVVSILNAAFLCFCTCRQRTIDLDVVPDAEQTLEIRDKKKEKTFYSNIEEKLQTLCEDKLLFLNPDLTRETLCLRLAINHTYLNMYFRKRGLSYYQYINSLRIEYAIKLMQENPNMSISEVSKQSGFRTQPTFRKVFQEVMGCLPSEVKKTSPGPC